MLIGRMVTSLLQMIQKDHNDLDAIGVDDHHNESHTHAEHENTTKRLFVRPVQGSGGSAINMIGNFPTLPLPNSQSTAASFIFQIPEEFVSYVGFNLIAAATNANGACRITVDIEQLDVDETVGTDTATELIDVVYMDGNNKIKSQGYIFGGSPPSFNVGDFVGVVVSRLGSHEEDDLTGTLNVFGIEFVYTANQ